MDDDTLSSITRVEGRREFRGWVDYPSSTFPWFCTGNLEFQFSDSYAGCCAQGRCSFITSCNGDRTYLMGSDTGLCDESLKCSTVLVFETSGAADRLDASTVWSHIACFSGPSITGIYRTYPGLESAIETTSTDTTATVTTDTSTADTTTMSDSTATRTTPADEGDGEKDADSSNMAWIAGAVVGSVALIVFAGLLIFWLRRRSLKKSPAQAQPMLYSPSYATEAFKWQQSPDQTMGTHSSPPPAQWGSPPLSEISELPVGSRASELPGCDGTHTVHRRDFAS